MRVTRERAIAAALLLVAILGLGGGAVLGWRAARDQDPGAGSPGPADRGSQELADEQTQRNGRHVKTPPPAEPPATPPKLVVQPGGAAGRIVFLHQPPGGPMEYAALDLDRGDVSSLGPAPETVSWGFQPNSARLSPDGTTIAFGKAAEIDVDGHKRLTSPDKIQIQPLNGKTGAEVVVDMPGAGIGPWYWSPDGSKLAFSSWEKQQRPRNWFVDVRTREVHEVTMPRFKAKDTEWPLIIEGWSPDGVRFLASGDGLYLVKTDGSESRQIVPGDRLRPGLLGGSCRFSPDGRQVLCVSADGNQMALLLADVASGKVRALAHGAAGLVQGCWSPDGHRVVCSMTAWDQTQPRAGATSLFVTDLDRNDTRQVPTDKRADGWRALLGWLPPATPPVTPP
jgi:hypothetical protein